MAEKKQPWIAFKVLAAGAIQPKSGFKYAFEGGADFLAVGMFDFEVAEDLQTAKDMLKDLERERPGAHKHSCFYRAAAINEDSILSPLPLPPFFRTQPGWRASN